MANALYYGDNLVVLRQSIATESVDHLVYLDVPFNSQATYNLRFKVARPDLGSQVGGGD